jgi:hypothetical protein
MSPGSEAEKRNESVIERCEVTPQVNKRHLDTLLQYSDGAGDRSVAT